jgi:aminoglycoside/choline kinase family phosphotransferase
LTPPAPSQATPAASEAGVSEWIERAIGRPPHELVPISPGLGHRRFLRVVLGPDAEPASLILRIDPPAERRTVNGVAPEPELEPIRALLEAHGLPVPHAVAHDADRGWDLLEDVGDLSLEAAVARADARERIRLYRQAVHLVPRLQAISAPSPRIAAFERRLDAALIASKARKVIDWLLPECLGRAATAVEAACIEGAFDAVAEAVADAPARLSHRDMKAANLHLRPAASATAGLAGGELVLIDLQGAFLAPPEYDLVCLLRDSQVPLPEEEVQAHLEAVREELPDAPSRDAYALRLDQLTLTRVGKDLAHYLHAARARGDTRYLSFVESGLRCWREAVARLRDEAELYRDLTRLIDDLPQPALCTSAPHEQPPCAR